MNSGRKEKIIKHLQKWKIIYFFMLVFFTGGGFAAMQTIGHNPAFCSSCHVMQNHYDSWSQGELSAKKHADAGLTCHDCHIPTLSQQLDEGVKFITGNYETPLKKREFPKAFCLSCHDFQKAKAKTDFHDSNPHDSHEGDLSCYSCHSIHRKSQTTCSECHSFPWMNQLPANWKK